MKKLLALLGLTALVAGLAYVLRAPVVGDDGSTGSTEHRYQPEPSDKSEDVDSFDEA